jgi:hypothetical protein
MDFPFKKYPAIGVPPWLSKPYPARHLTAVDVAYEVSTVDGSNVQVPKTGKSVVKICPWEVPVNISELSGYKTFNINI